MDNSEGYIRSKVLKNGKRVTSYEHRYVWEQANGKIPEGFHIHHRDGNKRNNKIENLELKEIKKHISEHNTGYKHTESAKIKISKYVQSSGLRSSNTSGFKGVIFDKLRAKWMARIKVDKIMIHLGRFDSPESAAKAYDSAALKYFGDDCFQNFPQDNHETKKSKI
jgi:hypothetical protein